MARHLALGAAIEDALHDAVDRGISAETPPRLAAALRYAVFPGGSRLRPQLAAVTALACDPHGLRNEAVLAAGVAVELVHCASLVHDDMPCFDDADTRRGKATVHKAFSEPTALLVGDALIVLAFDVLARGFRSQPHALATAIAMLAEGAGAARGIIAGQAWEEEPSQPLEEYHRAKTASLFACAAGLAALAVGADPKPFRHFGELLGRAYQAADDLRDATGDAAALGKPIGRDEALARPSLVRAHGVRRARLKLATLISEAEAALPPLDGADVVRDWIRSFAGRLEAG